MTESYIVTGALGGIGSAVAVRLARTAARLCLNDADLDVFGGPHEGRHLAKPELTHELAALGAEVRWIPGRVERPETADLLMDAALDGGAALTGVVNCAGILGGGRVSETSVATWRAVVDVHLTGSFLIARAFGRAVRMGHAAVLVLVTSAAGLRPIRGAGPYGAAKAGVAGLAQCVALETGKYGARAYALSPWAMTRLAAHLSEQDHRHVDRIRALTAERSLPLPRNLDPSRVAETVAFLIRTPDQLACIVESAGDQIATYRRTPALSFAVAEESGPEDVLAALNRYARQAGERREPRVGEA